MDPNASDPVEEREEDMSSLVVGFVIRMRKRATSAQGETTPGFEVSGEKRPKWSGLDEEVQKSSTVVTVDSPEQASGALLALKGASQEASKEACASLEDGVPTKGP